MAKTKASGRWVVEQIVFSDLFPDDVLSGSREKASFDDEEQARAHCDQAERATRHDLNPFRTHQGCLAGLTSFEPAVFRDWLLDAGIVPPEIDPPPDWADWYDSQQSRWDDLQRERFWEALDLFRVYRVTERPARKGYVVMEIGWLWCDEPPYYTHPECRQAVEVFSDRAAAERRRRDLEQQRRQEWPAHMTFSWDGGHGELASTPLYEVVEVDRE